MWRYDYLGRSPWLSTIATAHTKTYRLTLAIYPHSLMPKAWAPGPVTHRCRPHLSGAESEPGALLRQPHTARRTEA
jgi:hypothetical protein